MYIGNTTFFTLCDGSQLQLKARFDTNRVQAVAMSPIMGIVCIARVLEAAEKAETIVPRRRRSYYV